MRIQFTREAELDYLAAVSFLESQDEGLGEQLRQDVNETLSRVEVAPDQFRLRHSLYRRVNLGKFNYYLAYVIENKVAVVVALCHQAKPPESWLDRL